MFPFWGIPLWLSSQKSGARQPSSSSLPNATFCICHSKFIRLLKAAQFQDSLSVKVQGAKASLCCHWLLKSQLLVSLLQQFVCLFVFDALVLGSGDVLVPKVLVVQAMKTLLQIPTLVHESIPKMV